MKNRIALFTAALLVLGTRLAPAQTRTITGKVTDSVTTEAVVAGQVSVQGTPIVVAIRTDGTFIVSVPERAVLLVVRSIGFKSKGLNVPAGQNTVQFRLAKDLFRLETVVVTGQATGVVAHDAAITLRIVDRGADQRQLSSLRRGQQAAQHRLAEQWHIAIEDEHRALPAGEQRRGHLDGVAGAALFGLDRDLDAPHAVAFLDGGLHGFGLVAEHADNPLGAQRAREPDGKFDHRPPSHFVQHLAAPRLHAGAEPCREDHRGEFHEATFSTRASEW